MGILVAAITGLVITTSGNGVFVQYDEPVTDDAGHQLMDLLHTTIYYQIADGTPTRADDIAATSPMGGGHVSQLVVVVLPNLPPGPENGGPASGKAWRVPVSFWATASDLAGESLPSPVVTVLLP